MCRLMKRNEKRTKGNEMSAERVTVKAKLAAIFSRVGRRPAQGLDAWTTRLMADTEALAIIMSLDIDSPNSVALACEAMRKLG